MGNFVIKLFLYFRLIREKEIIKMDKQKFINYLMLQRPTRSTTIGNVMVDRSSSVFAIWRIM